MAGFGTPAGQLADLTTSMTRRFAPLIFREWREWNCRRCGRRTNHQQFYAPEMRVANRPDVSSIGGESRCKVQNVISCKTLASGGTCSLAARRQDKGMSRAAHALFMARSMAEHIGRRQVPSIAFSRDEVRRPAGIERDAGLFRLDVRKLDHLGPLFGFRTNEFAEIRG